eukprot:1385861-Lingulodinium_polyedra.AAC.1
MFAYRGTPDVQWSTKLSRVPSLNTFCARRTTVTSSGDGPSTSSTPPRSNKARRGLARARPCTLEANPMVRGGPNDRGRLGRRKWRDQKPNGWCDARSSTPSV